MTLQLRSTDGRKAATNWTIVGFGALMIVWHICTGHVRAWKCVLRNLGLDPMRHGVSGVTEYYLPLHRNMVTHILEASIISRQIAPNTNVPLGFWLWWKWYLGHIVGGMTSAWTLGEIVKEEEKKRKST